METNAVKVKLWDKVGGDLACNKKAGEGIRLVKEAMNLL